MCPAWHSHFITRFQLIFRLPFFSLKYVWYADKALLKFSKSKCKCPSLQYKDGFTSFGLFFPLLFGSAAALRCLSLDLTIKRSRYLIAFRTKTFFLALISSVNLTNPNWVLSSSDKSCNSTVVKVLWASCFTPCDDDDNDVDWSVVLIAGSDDAVDEVVDIVSAGEEVTTDALLVSARYQTMVIGNFFIMAFAIIVFVSSVMGQPYTSDSRHRRSPQTDNPWCQSAFLNFLNFSPRMCPKPPLCTLSRPLKRRRC